jgi:predicted anti-sigma-YlaC factor YlaD
MDARRPDGGVLAFLLAFAAASLLHHVHNAEFLQDYPNLPASLSRGQVYAAWLGEAAIGAAGWVLFRLNYKRIGLGAIGVYALAGFGGLAHYAVAPLSAHTLAMNATIWLEAATGALLLAAVLHRSYSG